MQTTPAELKPSYGYHVPWISVSQTWLHNRSASEDSEGQAGPLCPAPQTQTHASHTESNLWRWGTKTVIALNTPQVIPICSHVLDPMSRP